MKVRIELDENETVEEAEEALEKAIKSKIQSRNEYFAKERYADQHVEDFHEEIIKEHETLLKRLVDDIKHNVKKGMK